MTQREQQILQLIAEDPMISQQQIADILGIARSSAAVHISNLMKKGLIAGKGYVLRPTSGAVVVGGANVDICGCSSQPLVAADSNPGTVTTSLGGVGRNIAHNLSFLDVDVTLLTAYGEDMNGDRLRASCTQLGIDIGHALRLSDASTSTYLYVCDPEGEMAVAVSDMSICDRITPDYLSRQLSLLQNARVVVADTNIPAESLQYLAENCTVPLFVDPVSTAKAVKLLPILSSIHTLKPNQLEAELLSGVPIRSPEDAVTAVKVLLDKGVQQIFLTMGADGVLAATQEGVTFLPNPKCNPLNTTGCGDSFMAAIVWAHLEELSAGEAARAGLAAASITMESTQTIHPDMSRQTLQDRINAQR